MYVFVSKLADAFVDCCTSSTRDDMLIHLLQHWFNDTLPHSEFIGITRHFIRHIRCTGNCPDLETNAAIWFWYSCSVKERHEHYVC